MRPLMDIPSRPHAPINGSPFGNEPIDESLFISRFVWLLGSWVLTVDADRTTTILKL